MADDMFRAPVQRAMQTLDRSKFTKIVPLKAARVLQNQNIASVRRSLQESHDVLASRVGFQSIRPDPDASLAAQGRKVLLLRPELNTYVQPQSDHNDEPERIELSDDIKPHSAVLDSLAKDGLVEIIPYELRLDYKYWDYHDIITAVLPAEDQEGSPSGFAQAGHVAHLNIRDEWLKYKYLIAEILMDKNNSVRTVINKLDDVGEESEYRTFKYEVLAGPDDMNVTVSEQNCIYKFDFSKVYWNTRLNTEHTRMVNMLKPGEAVCDVMAGIGPFAIPAGKKRVFVYANDLNPHGYISLKDAITRNKVYDYVRPFNEDGRTFIPSAVRMLYTANHTATHAEPQSRSKGVNSPAKISKYQQPKTFQHFIMNLPASALTFLPCFKGLYADPMFNTLPLDTAMPLIHVYCFNTKSDDNKEESRKICEEISGLLNYQMHLGPISEGGMEIHDVRDVAPSKRMFCASFRLPAEVAFHAS